MRKNSLLVSAVLIAFVLAMFMPSVLASSSSTPESLYLGIISQPRFLPATINAGDVVTLNLDVTSSAVQLSIVDVNAVLELSNYFEPIVSIDSIGNLDPDATGTVLLKFKVKDSTPPGFYTINLKLNYLRDGELVTQTQIISVPVSVGQKNLVIGLNPKTISPGNQTTLSYSITNNGLTAVSNLLFSWSESSGLVLPLGSDNRKFISRINSGETVDVNYLVAVDPNITTGIYPLDVEISYNDSNGSQVQKSTIGIIAGGATDFDVSSDYSGSSLSFSIANVGSNNAAATVVKLVKQSGLTISGSDTVIIGALNKGDYSIANFTVQSASSDQNAYSGANGFRRASGASTTTSTNSAGSNAFGSPPTEDANARGAMGGVPPTNSSGVVNQAGISSVAGYVVDIYYTDTTGERQHVQKNFTLSSRSTGFAAGTTVSGFSNSGQSTDWVLVGAVLGVIVAAGAVFNKFRGKKNWKTFGIIAAVGIIVPVIILLVVPKVYSLTVLAAVFLAGIVIVFFAMRGK
ncbi:MAG: hypothetical protein WCI04_03815 [archaeon]